MFPAPCQAAEFGLHLAQQGCPYWSQSMVRNTNERGIVILFLPSVNVPVAVGKGVPFGSLGRYVQQQLQTIFDLDSAEIGAIRVQFVKQRPVVCGAPLTDDGDP